MNLNKEFKFNQSEEFYRKLLLLDKLKKELLPEKKNYIFEQGHCWDLLLKENDEELVEKLTFNYVAFCAKKPVPELEPYFCKNALCAFAYASRILKDRFPMGEIAIKKNKVYNELYNNYLLTKDANFDTPNDI